MFKCRICHKRHYKGSDPALKCHSVDNPKYIAYLTKMHMAGFHTDGNGGHLDCPSCGVEVQLRLFDVEESGKAPSRDFICGCQG